MTHKGSCHCGKVVFEVVGEIKSGLACNCSICQKKGSLLWFAGNAMAAINIRCLDDVDLASIPVQNFDGRSH